LEQNYQQQEYRKEEEQEQGSDPYSIFELGIHLIQPNIII
jgi:hypothetical protein